MPDEKVRGFKPNDVLEALHMAFRASIAHPASPQPKPCVASHVSVCHTPKFGTFSLRCYMPALFFQMRKLKRITEQENYDALAGSPLLNWGKSVAKGGQHFFASSSGISLSFYYFVLFIFKRSHFCFVFCPY